MKKHYKKNCKLRHFICDPYLVTASKCTFATIVAAVWSNRRRFFFLNELKGALQFHFPSLPKISFALSHFPPKPPNLKLTHHTHHQLTPSRRSPACRRSPPHSPSPACRRSPFTPSSSSLRLHTLSVSHSQPSLHNRFSFLSLPNPNLALNRFIFFSHPILLRFQLTRSTIHHRWFHCSERLVNQLC